MAVGCYGQVHDETRDSVRVVKARNGKYQLVNKGGNALTEPIYDTIYYFSNGIATVKRNNSLGLIDARGKEVTSCVFSEAPLRFGETQFQPYVHGRRAYVSWLCHNQVLGIVWIDEKGQIMLSRSKKQFTIKDRIPEKLWDY